MHARICMPGLPSLHIECGEAPREIHIMMRTAPQTGRGARGIRTQDTSICIYMLELLIERA